MPLDPQAQAFLDQMAALNTPPISLLPPEIVRLGIKMQLSLNEEPEQVARIENRVIPGPESEIPVRIYTPEGNGPFPMLVYFHGGGWVICDLDTHDGLCRSLANGAGCIVVSVDYRLAPEHKFPAAPLDCYASTKWVAAHADQLNGDPARIALGGDSAGGNLTAVVAQMVRDQGGPPLVFQLLIFPVTDIDIDTVSKKENAVGYFLTLEDMFWFRDNYLNNEEERKNPLVSPLQASDLSGLPPALIITAEYDPLRDEGEIYGQKLKEAGVPVTVTRYDGLMHWFLIIGTTFTQSRQALTQCTEALRAAFNA